MARTRARTESGHFKADDPSTPDVNEAFVEEEKKPAKKTTKKSSAQDLPPKGSSDYKRLVLLGEIKE
tara:strand:+ start:428 stop:628 length:201 start_codon:yes stop_codon:yes gene_type:complete